MGLGSLGYDGVTGVAGANGVIGVIVVTGVVVGCLIPPFLAQIISASISSSHP